MFIFFIFILNYNFSFYADIFYAKLENKKFLNANIINCKNDVHYLRNKINEIEKELKIEKNKENKDRNKIDFIQRYIKDLQKINANYIEMIAEMMAEKTIDFSDIKSIEFFKNKNFTN